MSFKVFSCSKSFKTSNMNPSDRIVRDISWLIYSIFIIIPNIFIIIKKLKKSPNGLALVIVNNLIAMIFEAIVCLGNTNEKLFYAIGINFFCHSGSFLSSLVSIWASFSLVTLMIFAKHDPDVEVRKAEKWIAINFVICFFYSLIYSSFVPVTTTVQEDKCFGDFTLPYYQTLMIRITFESIIPTFILITAVLIMWKKKSVEENLFFRYTKICALFSIINGIIIITYDVVHQYESVTVAMVYLSVIFNAGNIFHPILYCMHDQELFNEIKNKISFKSYVIFKNDAEKVANDEVTKD